MDKMLFRIIIAASLDMKRHRFHRRKVRHALGNLINNERGLRESSRGPAAFNYFPSEICTASHRDTRRKRTALRWRGGGCRSTGAREKYCPFVPSFVGSRLYLIERYRGTG